MTASPSNNERHVVYYRVLVSMLLHCQFSLFFLLKINITMLGEYSSSAFPVLGEVFNEPLLEFIFSSI